MCCWVWYSVDVNQVEQLDCFIQVFHIPFFSLLILSIVERKVLKCLTLNVELSISPFKSVSFCFKYFVPLLLSAYRFRILIFSCCIHSFMILKCPFLPLVSLNGGNRMDCLINDPGRSDQPLGGGKRLDFHCFKIYKGNLKMLPGNIKDLKE